MMTDCALHQKSVFCHSIILYKCLYLYIFRIALRYLSAHHFYLICSILIGPAYRELQELRGEKELEK